MTISSESPKKKEAKESIPPDLWPIYEQLIGEYKSFSIEHYGKPWFSYLILADLINAGWRPTHKPFIKFV